MINSKQDLEYYCLEDLKRFGNKKPSIKDWILHNEEIGRASCRERV